MEKKLLKVIVYGGGTDDTDAIEMIMNGKAKGINPDGSPFVIMRRTITITRSIKLEENAPGVKAFLTQDDG